MENSSKLRSDISFHGQDPKPETHPTIVVIGDQSSGKSSLLESLAGIVLPRGERMCTRTPLIMRLKHHLEPAPEFLLHFQEEIVEIDKEYDVSRSIGKATQQIAGDDNSISRVPLSFTVKKRGVPDVTIVDLLGSTRVPIHQPSDIYTQISGVYLYLLNEAYN